MTFFDLLDRTLPPLTGQFVVLEGQQQFCGLDVGLLVSVVDFLVVERPK